MYIYIYKKQKIVFHSILLVYFALNSRALSSNFWDIHYPYLLDIYIYIYIYIYCHSQIDCFVASQFLSVARHVGRLKLGSKPTQLYVRLSIILLSE